MRLSVSVRYSSQRMQRLQRLGPCDSVLLLLNYIIGQVRLSQHAVPHWYRRSSLHLNLRLAAYECAGKHGGSVHSRTDSHPNTISSLDGSTDIYMPDVSARITGGGRGGPAPLVPGRAPSDTTTKWG